MLATLRLLNAYFWKTIYGPILAFVFPVILLGILGNVLRLEYVYPGLIALTMMFLGVIALPLAVMELKNSSLFKYIGSSPVSPFKFTSVVIGFYTFVAIITGAVVFLATMAIFPAKVFPNSGFVNGVLGGIFFTWRGTLSFYFGALVHLIFVVVSGLIIATFARTPQQALTIGIILVLPTMFLSGMVISVDVIAESPVMNWISRFIPYRYSTGNLVVAATPINQLRSAIDYWLTQPFQTGLNPATGQEWTVNDKVNGAPNNLFDQIIWPFADPPLYTNANNKVIDASGYRGWVQSTLTTQDLTLKPGYDPTLYNLLVPNWRAMELNSSNNMFNWLEDWGVRKVPSVEGLISFVSGYFRGVDKNGQPLETIANNEGLLRRVQLISQQIFKGDFRWIDVFISQSNILYSQAEKVLNVLLPLGFTGVGSLYIFKRFNWVAH